MVIPIDLEININIKEILRKTSGYYVKIVSEGLSFQL